MGIGLEIAGGFIVHMIRMNCTMYTAGKVGCVTQHEHCDMIVIYCFVSTFRLRGRLCTVQIKRTGVPAIGLRW